MQGKTFLTAIFCCVRCILYPKTIICIASRTREQGTAVINKITEILMKNSKNLYNEIDLKGIVINNSKAEIPFKNGSLIKVVTAKDTARSGRANILVVDEFRMVDLGIIDTVLRKFLIGSRQPKYLSKPEYAHLLERNKELYLSSAWYTSHWSFKKLKSYVKNMLDDKKKFFACGLPYQLAVKEKLLDQDAVNDWAAEGINPVEWQIEMECLFYGSSESCYFSFEDLDKMRVLQQPIYPRDYYGLLDTSKKIKQPSKVNGEIRILTSDIAVMGGSKNDQTAIFIIQLIPSGNQYIRNVVYGETLSGAHTFDQAIKIRQLYDDFDIDYVVIDTNGVGMAVYENLNMEQIDTDRGVVYPAWDCINDENMAIRTKSKDAQKILYSIKATAQFNSDCAVLLRDGIRRGKIKFLISEIDGREWLNTIKSYRNLEVNKQVMFDAPYLQTSALISEMINLDYENNNGKIKVKEAFDKRKDRYSSIAYGYYVSCELERMLTKHKKVNKTTISWDFKSPDYINKTSLRKGW